MFKQKTVINLLISFCAFAILFSSFLYIVDTIDKRNKFLDEKYVLEKFSNFQSEMESQIIESISLLEGYLSFIETRENTSEEDVTRYLSNLLEDKITIIRNISILEDTTIKWVYPKKGNENAIGLDLITIPNQKNDLIKVKNDGKHIFAGPINLVQGGTGFIARIPVYREEKYWGQASIVFDGDMYLNYITEKSIDSRLNVAIFNENDFPNSPFYGDSTTLEEDGMVLNMTILDSQWVVVATPIDGWSTLSELRRFFQYFMFFISITISMLLYILLQSRQRLVHMTHTDILTGLNNRHALNHYVKHLNQKNTSNYIVSVIDLNNLKLLNDTHGHKAGDLVIQAFAKKLNSISTNTTYTFRLGGDEFMIISKEAKEIDVNNFENKLQSLTHFKLKYKQSVITVTAGIGTALYPKDGSNFYQVAKKADQNMYINKLHKKTNQTNSV